MAEGEKDFGDVYGCCSFAEAHLSLGRLRQAMILAEESYDNDQINENLSQNLHI